MSGIKCHHCPLDNTHGRTTLSVACDFLHCNEHTVEGYWAWHFIITIGQNKQGQTMSGVACHHRPWETPTVRRSQAWHGIIALGKHTWSNYVGCGIPSFPLDNIDSRPTSEVSSYHPPWLAHTVRRRRQWK